MEIAQFVADWLGRAGVEARIDEVAPGRANVIGVARGRGGGAERTGVPTAAPMVIPLR